MISFIQSNPFPVTQRVRKPMAHGWMMAYGRYRALGIVRIYHQFLITGYTTRLSRRLELAAHCCFAMATSIVHTSQPLLNLWQHAN